MIDGPRKYRYWPTFPLRVDGFMTAGRNPNSLGRRQTAILWGGARLQFVFQTHGGLLSETIRESNNVARVKYYSADRRPDPAKSRCLGYLHRILAEQAHDQGAKATDQQRPGAGTNRQSSPAVPVRAQGR